MPENTLYTPFRYQLKILREREHLTMAELSKLSGISQPYISQLESGRLPSDKVIDDLSLGLSKGKLSSENNNSENAYTDYKNILVNSFELDEIRRNQEAIDEATKRLQFAHLDINDKELLHSLEQQKKSEKNPIAIGKQKLTTFFGLDVYPENISEEEAWKVLTFYENLDSNNKIKAIDYLKYLIHSQKNK